MKYVFSFLSLLLVNSGFSQSVNPENILILRDDYGVPYIYSKTDAEAAYGLAWVQSEDNFYDVQESLLASRGLLGQLTGKDGALLDALSFLVDAESAVNNLYESSISANFEKILTAYCDGINRYAETHPNEIRHNNLFPVTNKDVLKTYVLNMALISNITYDLGRLLEGEINPIQNNNLPGGSNGIAVNSDRTTDGKSYLVCNSHQPLNGFAAWYEVQVNSEEGWQFHGATFAAGVTPFIGSNKHLGWTHTVNYDDFHDVYELEMHPNKKNYYKWDEEWVKLEENKLKLKVKLAGIAIPVSKKFYKSKHGLVIKNKEGYFALRFPANQVIGCAEQWYHMNKANNLNEFKQALSMQQLTSLNIIYADDQQNILYLANGLFPFRNPDYDWQKIVPGNTKSTLWERNFMPLDSLILVENPSSGYVFNMNNTSFDCSAPEDNPKQDSFNKTIGYQEGETARSLRFHDLIDTLEQISYSDLKRMKYDAHMKFPLYNRTIQNLELIRNLDPNKYPDLADIIEVGTKWNGSVDANNKQAAIFSLAIQEILKQMQENHNIELNKELEEEVYVDALRFAKKHLLKHFGTMEIELGELQKHVRGDIELPIGGIPEAITAMYTLPYKDGKYRSYVGESYILFAVYGKHGLEKMESVHCYGTSNHSDSPHYTDQMQMFVNKELKEISLNKDENLKKAKRAYRPK